MFEKNRNNQEPDALDERIHGLRNGLRASAKLKAAAIDGEPLRRPAVGTRTHVRRFSKAIAVYAMCALLLLGTAIALPSLLKGKGPMPAGSSTSDPAQSNPSIDPVPDVVEQITVTAGYDYGEYKKEMATLLYGGYLPFFDLPEEIDRPLAGDVYTIDFDGSATLTESYPGGVSVDGTIASVAVEKAKIVRVVYSNYGNGETFEIYHDNGDREIVKVVYRPDYIVQGVGGDGKIEPLSEVMYDQFYATYSPVDGYSEEEGYRFAAFYSGCPRYEKREPHPDSLEAVKELNEHTNLSLPLLAIREECDLSEYKGNKGFGCYIYEKDGCEYWFTAYPDYDNGGWYLTSVVGEKRTIEVFGVNGSESDVVIMSALLANDYKVLDWAESAQLGNLIFLKNGVQISFIGSEGERRIQIALYVSNDTGVIY
ncbi:MAG: hypothetical protein IJW98_06360 [Clostridia bacterium]|nr:hypothetical protein [Clostridia bacterium]